MPTYSYLCDACGGTFEIEQRISEDPIKKCSLCGKSQARRQIVSGNFILKGGGWYSDGYGSKSPSSSSSSPSTSSDSSSSSSSTSTSSTSSTTSTKSTSTTTPSTPAKTETKASTAAE